MKAITRDRYGSADVLDINDIAKPVVRDNEVLVRVRAVGVGPHVWHVMTGRPFMTRTNDSLTHTSWMMRLAGGATSYPVWAGMLKRS
jgi:NADPH:quinone reductase-like Zn-dependent oxidoreductase